MTLTDVIARIKPLEPDLRSRGIDSLYLFGSVARGEGGPSSDIDMMCELSSTKQVNLLDFAQFTFELEDHLGVKVDLCERQALRPRVRAFAESEKVRIF